MMLKNVCDRPAVSRKVAIVTGTEVLDEMIEHLAVLWKYRVTEPGDPEAMLLEADGSASPFPGQPVIRVGRNQTGEPGRLQFPLHVEQLWQAMESRFQKSPRRHFRVDIESPARVTIEGQSCNVELQSLSDMGCRFYFDRELVRQQELAVAFGLDNHPFQFDARVIYSISNPTEQNPRFRTGLVFHIIERRKGERLRNALIHYCLESAREKMDEQRYREALKCFFLPADIRDRLVS